MVRQNEGFEGCGADGGCEGYGAAVADCEKECEEYAETEGD